MPHFEEAKRAHEELASTDLLERLQDLRTQMDKELGNVGWLAINLLIERHLEISTKATLARLTAYCAKAEGR